MVFHRIVNVQEIFGAVRTNLSPNYVTYRPGQASSLPVPSSSSPGSVLLVALPDPQVCVRHPISDWSQRVPTISFVGIVEPSEDTRYELTFARKPVFSTYSRPTYPNLFALAVNRLGRSGRNRGTRASRPCSIPRNFADSGVGSKMSFKY